MAQKDQLEAGFKRLDEIIEKMEQGELSLEESFRLYKEGVGLVAACNESIEKVENEIKVIEDEAQGVSSDEL